jgi:hypothetical protein
MTHDQEAFILGMAEWFHIGKYLSIVLILTIDKTMWLSGKMHKRHLILNLYDLKSYKYPA